MKKTFAAFTLIIAGTLPASAADPAPNGITLPKDYKDWRVLSVHTPVKDNDWVFTNPVKLS